MMTNRVQFMLLALSLLATGTIEGFVLPQECSIQHRRQFISISSPTSLLAKKKKKNASSGQGFGKVAEESPAGQNVKPTSESASPPPTAPKADTSFLQSIDQDVSKAAVPKVDESVPLEERTSSILRGYGLRTLEEQQEEMKRQEQVQEERKKLEEWKKMAESGEDFDIMAMLPAPVLVFIDRFLKAGVAICTVLFVLAGLGITVEAWSKASDSPLPEDVDAFITNVVEPNFTPGLLVLLGFSISLGAFAAAQLGSASSTYREDR